MGLGEELMVAGIGCRTGVSGEQVEAAIAATLAALHGAVAGASGASGRAAHESAAVVPSASAVHEAARRAHLTAIATPAAKATEPGIQAAAAARGLPVLAISQPDLEAANPATVTRSAHSMAAMNVHSVAEAAALAGATQLGKAPALSKTTALAKATPPATSATPTARLLQPRVAVGPVTCALADTTPP